MMKTLSIPRSQRVALIRDGRFERLLGPGRHALWIGWSVVELVELAVSEYAGPVAAGDLLPAELPGARVVDVAAEQVGIYRLDGVDRQVLSPGRWRFWELDGRTQEIWTIDIRARPQPLSDDDRLGVGDGSAWEEAAAGAGRDEVLVLVGDGVPVEVLGPGRYRTWRGGPWTLEAVDTGLQVLELAAQDVVTKDEVPVRVKPAATWRVTDPLAWVDGVLRAEPLAALSLAYGAVQRALREVLATFALDELTAARADLSAALLDATRAALPGGGEGEGSGESGVPFEVTGVWVKDLILPGEVKDIVRQVTLAKKESEARAIRRREEVAQTRQLANTAKLLEQSPVLMRLKELEAMGELLSQLSGKVDKLVLVGGGDAMGELAGQVKLQVAGDAVRD